MAIVGCSSEDFNDPSVTQAIDDSRLIQLDENFVLAGVGAEGTTTRTHWEWEDPETKEKLVNKFLPILTANATVNAVLDTKVNKLDQSVGLCWLGEAGGAKVYTNYQFYHFGWLKQGETKATVECNELTNGAWYNDIKFATVDPENDVAGNEPNTGRFDWVDAKDFAINKLNYNSGVYKTENKAIFGGQYIVYYPYNEDFKDAGTIPAVAQTTFGDPTAAPATSVPTKLDAPELGKATFRYSAPVEIKGGNQAADFGMYNLSSLVQLRVAYPKGVEGSTTIDQIVLYSEKEQLLKQANLAADKIAAGKKGAELYAENETKGTKTIVANFLTAGVALKPKNGTGENKPTSAYITVLPTTVEDLVVLVHSKAGQWAKVSLGKTEFEAGAAKRLDIEVKDADFKANFIAVDDASLKKALDEARPHATDKDHAQTITVIGDITLKTVNSIAELNDKFITIKGGDIIVPEDKTLTLNTNMESNVRVLGKSCCSGEYGGRLVVQGGTINNVTLEKTGAKADAGTEAYNNFNPELKYEAAGAEASTATVAAGKTIDVQAGNVVVKMAVKHKGDIKIAEDAIVTVNGTTGENTGGLNFMGSNVTNDGTIEVKANGNFNMTNSDGGATAAAGKRMTNNGTFIHNVDAAVGTAVQSMNQNGEYRCKVGEQAELDDAYQKWTACSVIEIVAAPTGGYNLGVAKAIAYQHKGKYIDIEVNSVGTAAIFNNADLDNEEIKVGNLTVKTGGLVIDFVKDNGKLSTDKDYKIGKRTLTVNGDMTVAATSTIKTSQKINITENLTVKGGATLNYNGNKKNEEGLAVTKDINVNGATFEAKENALNITCANFYLKKVGVVPGTAIFGNRTDGAAKNMVVSGTIDNPSGCIFTITAPTAAGKLLAWVSCKELKVGGTFTGAQPQVVE